MMLAAGAVGEVEPAVGIEPTTHGLQNRCSTAELSWRLDLIILFRARPTVKPCSIRTDLHSSPQIAFT